MYMYVLAYVCTNSSICTCMHHTYIYARVAVSEVVAIRTGNAYTYCACVYVMNIYV